MRADCNASCGAEGAIFCDGEFVASGDDVTACAVALANEGIADLNLEGDIAVGTNPDGDAEVDLDAGNKAAAGCSLRAAGPSGGGSTLLWPLLGLAWAAYRRRCSVGTRR
jgi:MYXO-CTERM domain-containing protein